jgi:hypothetical protein
MFRLGCEVVLLANDVILERVYTRPSALALERYGK